MCDLFDDAQPLPHVGEEHLRSSHILYLPVGWFDVEHGRQVASAEACVTQEMAGLVVGWRLCREEMIGSHV